MKRRKKEKTPYIKGNKPEETALVLAQAEDAPKPAPRPITLADLRLEVLKRAGFDERTLAKAVKVLNDLMDDKEDAHARLGAARTVFALSNVVPSKSESAKEKLEVELVIKPFAQAQVVNAETVK